MNNKQFLKLLNESNNTFNNLTGIQNLNESEKLLFKDNLDNKLYFDEGDSIFINDWEALVKINDFNFTIGWSSLLEDNIIKFPNNMQYTYTEIKKALPYNIKIKDENLKEALLFIFDNFEEICKTILKKLNHKVLLGIPN